MKHGVIGDITSICNIILHMHEKKEPSLCANGFTCRIDVESNHDELYLTLVRYRGFGQRMMSRATRAVRIARLDLMHDKEVATELLASAVSSLVHQFFPLRPAGKWRKYGRAA